MESHPEADMDTTQKTPSKIWIQYGLLGFAFGVCLVSMAAVSLFAVQVANPPPTPTIAASALLDAAQEAYRNGNAQFVVDTLSPHLEEFTNPDELTEALKQLAMAEVTLGHYQISAAYLERLVQISPTFENYGLLARVYDSAGDLKHALSSYQILLKMDDPQFTPDLRQMIQQRVNQIQVILTGITPTPGS